MLIGQTDSCSRYAYCDLQFCNELFYLVYKRCPLLGSQEFQQDLRAGFRNLSKDKLGI